MAEVATPVTSFQGWLDHLASLGRLAGGPGRACPCALGLWRSPSASAAGKRHSFRALPHMRYRSCWGWLPIATGLPRPWA